VDEDVIRVAMSSANPRVVSRALNNIIDAARANDGAGLSMEDWTGMRRNRMRARGGGKSKRKSKLRKTQKRKKSSKKSKRKKSIKKSKRRKTHKKKSRRRKSRTRRR